MLMLTTMTMNVFSTTSSIYKSVDFAAVCQARFPFKRNRLHCVRCVNENRKKRKRLRLNGNRASVYCFISHCDKLRVLTFNEEHDGDDVLSDRSKLSFSYAAGCCPCVK